MWLTALIVYSFRTNWWNDYMVLADCESATQLNCYFYESGFIGTFLSKPIIFPVVLFLIPFFIFLAWRVHKVKELKKECLKENESHKHKVAYVEKAMEDLSNDMEHKLYQMKKREEELEDSKKWYTEKCDIYKRERDLYEQRKEECEKYKRSFEHSVNRQNEFIEKYQKIKKEFAQLERQFQDRGSAYNRVKKDRDKLKSVLRLINNER